MNMIEVHELTKTFPKRTLFENASFTLPRKGFYLLLGESGSGKSTLLSLFSMLDVTYQGNVRIAGQNPQTMSERERGDFRLKHIGFLHQESDLLDLETVLENILFPSYGIEQDKSLLQKRAMDLCKEVGLEGKEKQLANTLSGGERARVSLARALINDPEILLADEPTGALDNKKSQEMMHLLYQVSSRCLVFVVTHDEKLARSCGGTLCYLRDKKVIFEEQKSISKEGLLTVEVSKKGRKKLSSWPLIRHALQLLKAKKFRSFLFSSLMSLSFVLLGVSFYLTENLGKEVENSLSSLTGEREVILSSREPSASLRAANEGEISSLLYKMKDQVDGYGYHYEVSFPSYFPDSLECIFPINKMQTHVFANLDVSDVEEFRWLSDFKNQKFYPEIPKILEPEEVVLALPFSEMSKLCYVLKIQRTFRSLGNYLKENSFLIYLRMQNDNWQYHDEQVLSVRAFMEAEEPFFLHLDPFWNEWMLEFKMRFPVSEVPDDSEPWIMEKVPYLHLKGEYEETMSSFREKELDKSFLLEPPSEKLGKFTLDYGAKRLCVYHKDGGMEEDYLLNRLNKIEGVKGYRLFSPSYMSFPASFTEGFVKPFFLGKSDAEADLWEDSASYVSHLEDPVFLSLPSNSAIGSYLLPPAKGVRFSADFTSLIGEKPEGLEEIVLGEKLYRQLGSPTSIVILYPYQTVQEGEEYRYSYRRVKLFVTGFIKGGELTIHHNPYWTSDFFSFQIGTGKEESKNNAIAVKIDEDYSLEPFLDYFAANFPEFEVSSPSLTMKESLKETEAFLVFFLFFLSTGAFLLSSILLFTTAKVISEEGRREGRMLYLLGYSREEEVLGQSMPLFLLLLGSGVPSSVLLLPLEYFIHRSIYSYSGGISTFQIDIFPILLPFLIASIAYLIVHCFLSWQEKKRNFLEEGR